MKILWRCLALLGFVTITGAAVAQQAMDVPSLDQRAGRAIMLPGFWFAARRDAATPARAPAMLLLHGCGGMYDPRGGLGGRYRDLAARLNALGVHVLVADSLTPRGEKELCTQRTGSRAITMTQRRRDALGAVQWLAARGDVDPARVGLLGWSNGGSTVLATTNRRHREVLASTAAPSLAVAFYPGCENELKAGYEVNVPLLMLLGEADDWTPAAPCKALAEQAAGPRPQIEVYAGAYHGFDGNMPVRLRKDVPNGVHPGQGVHVGSDAAARAASAQRLEAFLRTQWQLNAR